LKSLYPSLVISAACFQFIAMSMSAASKKDAVLTATQHRIETSDFRASGRMISAHGSARTTYKFNVKGHWFPDGLHILYDFVEPTSAVQRLLLHYDAHGRVTVDTMLPGEKTLTRPNAEHQAKALLGTEVLYEDLIENQFFWSNQTIDEAMTYGDRHCINLKSIPTITESSRYSSVISCVDASIGYPLHVTKTIRGSGLQKDFFYTGLRQSSGIWTATQIKVEVAGESGSTLLLIDHGSAKAKLGVKDFDMNQPFNAKEH
jgi:hypothetical protein